MMQDYSWILLYNFAAVLIMMTIGWAISVAWRNVTLVDSLWGSGFVMIVWLTFFSTGHSYDFAWRRLLLAGLATIWGVRLTIYLSLRNWGKGEDPRYAKWRSQSGERFWWVSLFKVFWLQAVFLWLIALALQVGLISAGPGHWTWLDGLGLLFWLVGFYFEALGDWQMARFKSNPANRGKVMNTGLWALTRHPNYFGEFLIWWGMFLIVLSTTAGWWTIISPVLITLVLTRMTGIRLTEHTMLEKRPAYRDYIRTTNAFFPWPHRRNKE